MSLKQIFTKLMSPCLVKQILPSILQCHDGIRNGTMYTCHELYQAWLQYRLLSVTMGKHYLHMSTENVGYYPFFEYQVHIVCFDTL